jgi:hypothetical protein
MRYLRFFYSANRLKTVPRKLINVEQEVEGPNGTKVLQKLKPIVDASAGYDVVADNTDRQVLRVFKEDEGIAAAALAWVTGQDVNFSSIRFAKDERGHTVQLPPQEGPVIEIQLNGYLEPRIDEHQLHTLCESYTLLHDKFARYEDIFAVKLGENSLVRGLLEFLLESDKELAETVIELGGKDVKSRLEKIKLPDWIERVIQLRQEARATAGDGWE